MADRRATFAPVVLGGLAAAGLTAYAAGRPWATPEVGSDLSVLRLAGEGGQAPLVTALAMVVLASWGVLLIARGSARRLVGWLLALAAVATAGAVVVASRTLPAALRDDVAAAGGAPADVAVHWHGWYAVALAASALSLLAAGAALRWLGSWPEMGTKYDAPAAGRPVADAPETWWRALDEGHDPTI